MKLNCEELNEESGEYYSKIFDNAYQIRSSFLHDGESPLKLLKDIEGIEKYLDLEEDLQAIAKHLIAKKIKNT